ncbi:hypothetical protein DICPUDRAFT_41704 [Dictyostelium purpureum]|uniref:Trehalase n=1 Tax=Dictyostelium purpureum TaxID=5786 RepID=F1A0M5_DICPU|nr:uncharacterized protein DICPUDRAFT_41704 [Dictyostelium purpureum]EGC30247.1 hypothetical protein DICPUDRAFT_41704 [Dictyostelium purpureum]|eukprot:XP_003293219.1 hypothetical protein DICPUDRAFT_41704 [Dictyostelium purpureum]
MQASLFFLILSFLTYIILSIQGATDVNQDHVGGCQHPVYCTGSLLKTIQLNQVFNDSKTFVDMPMRYPVDYINQQFEVLMFNTSKTGGPNKAELLEFLNNNFYPAGYEVEPVTPVDWFPNPAFLDKIQDPELKRFATSVHGKWLDLTRVFNVSGLCDDCYSSIPVTHPFVIAGSRFREFYYWDTYWIIQGLLVSNMTATAKGMLTNFRDIITEYGFIPNGGRIYYLNRSQPPLYTLMVKSYVEATSDYQFLQETLPILDAEYQWFMKYRTTQINTCDGGSYTLNLYNVSTNTPRPESFYEDFTGASVFSSDDEQKFYYSSITSGAESGWDFCSRWFSQSDNTNLTTIQTIEVVPVDLNSILYYNEKTLSMFHNYFGNTTMSTFYQKAASERATAIQSVFWDENNLQWFDLNLETQTLNENFYISNLLPLFVDIEEEINMNDEEIDSIFKELSDVLLNFPGGIPSSLIDTNQQWDLPSAFPNLQYFVIELLMDTNTTVSTAIGRSLINRWVTTNYCGWNSTLETEGGMMFEKYNVYDVGTPGGGGEYVVQNGFGWTNGVVLHLLNKYSDIITLNSC